MTYMADCARCGQHVMHADKHNLPLTSHRYSKKCRDKAALLNKPLIVEGVTMKKWSVEIPITGRISIEVEAKSASAALERAWDLYGEGWETAGFDVDWNAVEKVTEGNVSHAELNEQSATEIKSR
jgi:hypothetical protein